MRKFSLTIVLIILNIVVHAEDKTSRISASVFEMAYQGDLARIKKLPNKSDLNAQDSEGMTPLMFASIAGQAETVRFLIDANVDLEKTNKAGDTALAIAVGNDQEATALTLLNAGAHTMILASHEHKPLLFSVVANNQTQLLQAMLKKNRLLVQTVDDERETALFEAVRYGSKDTIRILLKAGINRKHKNKKGQTALSLAKQLKIKSVVKLLSAK